MLGLDQYDSRVLQYIRFPFCWGLLLHGTGWIRLDARRLRGQLGVPPDAALTVSISGGPLKDPVSTEHTVLGNQNRIALPFWAGTANVTVSSNGDDTVLVATVNVAGWSDVPVVAVFQFQDTETASAEFELTYDHRNCVFSWTEPTDVSTDNYEFIFMVVLKGGDEALFHRHLSQGQRSLSLDAINRRTGPLVPTVIDPLKHQYQVIVFPADKQRRQVGRSTTLVVGTQAGERDRSKRE